MARPRDIIDPAGRKRRRALLERLGIAFPHEIENYSVGGRTAVLRSLEEHAALELKLRTMEPAYYSEDRHITLLKAISEERKAIAAMTAGIPRTEQLKMRLVK